jgi:hypothetical protein
MFRRSTSEDGDQGFTRRSYIRAYGLLKRAAGLAHRAIVTAKLRRLRVELICHVGMRADGSATPVADAARWPQRPLILGDKWDF